jgi:hypothetical protein
MFHPRHVKTRSRISVSAALAFLLLLIILPATPPTTNAAKAAVGEQGRLPAGGGPFRVAHNDSLQTAAPNSSLIQFSSAEYVIGEFDRHVDITVTRLGDLRGTPSVDYSTFDEALPGRASQKGDYEIALGTLNFDIGETSKTFRVLLVGDNIAEGDEEIGLVLSNPIGSNVSLGSPNTARIKIIDGEVLPPSTSPEREAGFLVRQHYLDFLNREADSGGLFWFNQINSCLADTQCRELNTIHVSAAFFLSIEFQRTGMLAYLTNKAAFGTRPSYVQFERDAQTLQRNFIFGQPGADAQLEVNKVAYFLDFVVRNEFAVRYPTTQTPAQFVDALFANAGIMPSTAERNATIAEFRFSTTNTQDENARAVVLRRVAENAAFARAEFNAAFVLMEYFGYLRRDPDDAGYNFWLNKLNAFNSDFVRAEMVKAFINSDEYRQRFGL